MPSVSRLDVFVLIVVGGGICETFFPGGEVRWVSIGLQYTLEDLGWRWVVLGSFLPL